MSKDIQYLTSDKFAELSKELEHLRTDKRKEVAEHLEYAKRLGDLSENAEYHQAREDQAEVEDRICRLEDLLKRAVIADTGSDKGIATVGSVLDIQKTDGSGSYTYTIVGSEEADTVNGKISNVSPLGSALLGRKQGDTVDVKTPKGIMNYKILSIK